MRTTFTLILFLLSVVVSDVFAQNWQWARGNTGTAVDGWAVATDPSGNVFVAGNNFGITTALFGSQSIPDLGPGYFQCVIAKYDANGNILWVNGTQNSKASVINIATDPSGNVYLFGSFESDTVQIGPFTLRNTVFPANQYFLAKFGPTGNVLWALNAGNCQYNYATLGNIAIALGTGGIATDASGYVYITANFKMSFVTIGTTNLTNTDPSGASDDILLVKYNPAGGVVWARSAGGSGDDDAYAITVTPAGSIYIAGVFGSPSITFGSSVINNTSPAQVAFIARFDASGNPVWACSSGGAGKEYAIGLASDNSDNVYLTGGLKDKSISFSGTVITNPDSVSVLYLVKFDPSNNVSWYKTILPFTDTGRGVWGYSVTVCQCGAVWVSGCMTDSVNIDGNILGMPAWSPDPVFIAGYTASGTYTGSAALQSGGDDQNGIACDGSGNVYVCSDYDTYPFNIGNDTFPTANGTEFLYVGKYATGSSPYKNAVCTNTDICLVNFTTLQGHAGYTNYVWNNGDTGASRTVADTGVFWVLGYDSCVNSAIDTFKVTAACDCQKSLFVPNAFTPNGDGQDDVFYPRCGVNVKKIKTFRVYNRWGELLFDRENLDPNDSYNSWDGTFNGNMPEPDVYVWVVEAICDNGNQVNRKGSVTVIR